MKYLLLILFILLVVFLTKALRSGNKPPRGPQGAPRERAEADKGGEQVMLACAQCGLHLPRNDALPGKGGVFCSEEHRAQFEARNDAGG